MRQFCFIFAFGLVASALLAADDGVAGRVNARPLSVPGLVSVVRVGRDGRLIRVLAPATTPLKPAAKSELRPSASVLSTPAPVVPAVEVTTRAQTGDTIDALIEIDTLIEDASNRYQVDPLLVKSVMQVESNFNPGAVSPKGAQGLMQLIPSTAQRFGVTDPFDSKQNIEGGVKYLRHLQDLFPTDLRLSLAAYNAGEGAVAKFGAIPPYKETVDYVQKVHQRYSNAKVSAAAKSVPTAEASAVTEPLVRHIEQVIDSEGRLFLRTR